MYVFCVSFFFKQKTAYEMRISDWSSDVCSSDLQTLSLFDAVAMIVGLVIGAGIFRLPSIVADNIDSGWLIIAVWALGGVVSLIGALCLAELATTYPHPGGEYHYLPRAYGRNCGFMFHWARMSDAQDRRSVV